MPHLTIVFHAAVNHNCNLNWTNGLLKPHSLATHGRDLLNLPKHCLFSKRSAKWLTATKNTIRWYLGFLTSQFACYWKVMRFTRAWQMLESLIWTRAWKSSTESRLCVRRWFPNERNLIATITWCGESIWRNAGLTGDFMNSKESS